MMTPYGNFLLYFEFKELSFKKDFKVKVAVKFGVYIRSFLIMSYLSAGCKVIS